MREADERLFCQTRQSPQGREDRKCGAELPSWLLGHLRGSRAHQTHSANSESVRSNDNKSVDDAYLGQLCKKVGKVLRAATQHNSVRVNRSVAEYDGDVGPGGVVEIGLEQRRRSFDDVCLVCHFDIGECSGTGI